MLDQLERLVDKKDTADISRLTVKLDYEARKLTFHVLSVETALDTVRALREAHQDLEESISELGDVVQSLFTIKRGLEKRKFLFEFYMQRRDLAMSALYTLI